MFHPSERRRRDMSNRKSEDGSLQTGPREDALAVAAERARAMNVTVTVTDSSRTVYVNYEFATREAAHELGDKLAELGFKCVWNNVCFDGEDEEWRFTDK
jgi:hypothetical protein